MSVVAQNQYGWILNHREFWNKAYRGCMRGEGSVNRDRETPNKQSLHYEIKEELFAIYRPYHMDSQFEKYAAKVKLETDNKVSLDTTCLKEKRKKRKRKCSEGQFTDCTEKQRQITDGIREAYMSLLKLGFEWSHFTDPANLPLNNNLVAREAAKLDIDTNNLSSCLDAGRALNVSDSKCFDILPEEKYVYSLAELHHRLYRHTGEHPCVMNCDGESYLIPAKSAFYLSQAGDINAFIDPLERSKFDVIVMDPPWENKSVKRKRKYYSLPDWDLLELPLPSLARTGCLVVVWVTNAESHQNYVKDVLFPHWSVTFLAEWHWLKVTQGGEPILDLDSDHKKPYETLLLGRFTDSLDKPIDPLPGSQPVDPPLPGSQPVDPLLPDSQPIDPSLPGSQPVESPLPGSQPIDPPLNQLIVSIPCSIHSKKPPLQDVLKEFCIKNPRRLELFARNMLSGWTSWGNEVLKHQNIEFYKSVP